MLAIRQMAVKQRWALQSSSVLNPDFQSTFYGTIEKRVIGKNEFVSCFAKS